MMIHIGFDSTLRPAEWIHSAKTFLSCPKDWLRWEMAWWYYSEHMVAVTILLMWGGQWKTRGSHESQLPGRLQVNHSPQTRYPLTLCSSRAKRTVWIQ